MADVTRDGSTFATPEANKLKVFVSYSRDDLDFADQLAAALQIAGFDPIIDRQGISGGEAWQQRLGNLILEADTVVFVLSPSSARSEVCAWEVEEAAKNGKRILPVLARPLEDAHPPVRLQNLNYMFFYHEPKSPGSGFGVGLSRLVTALNTDLGWIREHTRLLERATEWHAGGRAASRLLSGTDIVQAKAWAAQRPKGAPEPTPMHVKFIRASEQEESGRANMERKRLNDMAAAQAERAKALAAAEEAVRNAAEALRARNRARTIITWGSMVFAVVVAAAGIAAGWQWRIAVAERTKATEFLYDAQVARSSVLIDRAQQFINTGDFNKAALLTIEALDVKKKLGERFFYIPKADDVLKDSHRKAKRVKLGHAGPVYGVAVTPDGTRIVTGAWGEKPVRMWDAMTGSELLELKGHNRDVNAVAITADGSRIVTGSDDTTARVWDAKTGAQLLELKGHRSIVRSVAMTSDGSRIVTGSEDKTARVWDAKTGAELFQLKGHSGGVYGVAVTPDGTRIVTGAWGERPVRMWDAMTGNQLLELKGHSGDVNAVAISSDGTRIVTGSDDGTARIWDAKTGAELLQLKGHKGFIFGAAFSRDDARVVTGADDLTVRVWDAKTGQEMVQLKGHSASVQSVAFTPDGTRVVSGAGDNTATVWDYQKEREAQSTTLEDAKHGVKTCLEIRLRRDFALPPLPPEWCLAKEPYSNADGWKLKPNNAYAKAYGNFSNSALYNGDFVSAFEAANLGLEFDPSEMWININRAHALMFLGQDGKARSAYFEHRGKQLKDHGFLWDEAVVNDFAALRAAKLWRPLMDEIEKEFKKSAPAK